MRRAELERTAGAEPLEQAVEEAGGERVAAADPVEDLELRAVGRFVRTARRRG